jgi:hypothetical protein
MKIRGAAYLTIWLTGVAIVALLITGCRKSQTTRDSSQKSAVQMKRISVPTRVFSIAGEVRAFEATGEAGRTQEVSLSLKQLQTRFGRFERAVVYEYNREGKVLSQQESKVDSESGLTLNATTGNRYLLYPDLGPRFSNSYAVACGLGRAGISGQVVPRICTQIFCTDQPFPAGQLLDRIPELKTQGGIDDVGNGVIGGFGGHGNICEHCLNNPSQPDGNFIPARGCSDLVPVGLDPPPPVEVVVYNHQNYPTVANWHDQIYKTNSDGTGVVNLSNNEKYERSPDVNHKTSKIVFNSLGPSDTGLMTMDLNGNNRTLIPGTVNGSNPKWSRNGESFVVYTDLIANLNNSLHRVRLDGSENVEIVKAGEGNIIRTADVMDDNHIVFSRESLNRPPRDNIPRISQDGDIFIKDMRDNSEPVNLTNTPDLHEAYPVISHDGSLIAYTLLNRINFQVVEIHVARLTLPSTLTELHVIRLSLPTGRYLRDLDFSSDDKLIYVSGTVIEIESGMDINQLFSINFGGTIQVQVTLNDESDIEPSVVPR